MSESFSIDPFDPETDLDRPAVGDVVEYAGSTLRIEKVGWALEIDLVGELLAKKETSIMAKNGFDECLSRNHETRPFVRWIIWLNRISNVEVADG